MATMWSVSFLCLLCATLTVFAEKLFGTTGTGTTLLGQYDTSFIQDPQQRNPVGGPCSNSGHCEERLCCQLGKDRGRTCQPRALIGEDCTEFQVKSGAYPLHCPCLQGPDVPASTHRRRSTRSQSRALRGSQTADSWDDLSWDATIPEVDGAKSGDRSTTGRGRSLLNPRKLRRSMLSNPPRKFRCHACGYRTKYKMDLLNHVEHHAVSDTRDSHPQQHAPGQTHDSAGDVSRDFASNVAARAQPRGGEGTTKTEARLSKPKALKHSVVTGAPRKFCCHVCPFWTKYKNALLRHVNRHGDLQFKCGKRPAHGLPNAKLCLKRVTGTHARTTQRQGNKTKTTIDVKGGGPSQRADDASNDVTASKSEGSLPKAQRASSATEPVRSHAGVKPFGCGFCSRRFTRRAHLIVHVRLHTGEKPFKCEFCPRRFATKSQLVQHTRLHTGEKPYKCSACSLAFRLRKSLMVHMRSHSG